MKQSLLVTTAVAVLIGTGALAQSPNERAQSPNERSPAPSTAQSQHNANSPAAQAPAPSSAGSAATSQNAQSAPANNRQDTTTGQSAPNPNASDAQRPQAQSGQSPSSRSDNNATTAPSQAQSAQPPASSSQAQTNTSPATNQNQPATNSANNANPNNNAAPTNQPANNQANTTQQSSSNVSVSANLNDNQRTRISESITRLNAKPVTNVNFSLSVGTVVPRDVHFQPLPADIVEIVPQYRGYNFVVVRDDIVIVEPSTYKIVDVLPRAGRSAAQAPASQPTAAAAPSRKNSFSDNDREVIRKHARSSRTEERGTTGSATSTTRVRVGDRLPDSVEIRSFPDEVYRASPSLREYRYIERDNRTYVVEPRERTIIEEID